jgi:uncharacterized protein involved in exopolysaccharide biosynthesis
MESQFYQINILKTLLKWKLHLIIIVVAAIVIGAIFSSPMFITPKFKSFAVVYPANIAPYSDETETEQMLQILQSRDIIDSIIYKFDLSKHYGIDRSYEYYYTSMMYEWSQNVKISKTTYDGVSIEVMDESPDTASLIVEAMIELYNNKVRLLHEEKFLEVVHMYERAVAKKKSHLDSLEFRLFELSTQYGLLDYESQSREVTRGFLKTIDGSGSSINTAEVKKLKENIEKKGGELIILKELIEFEAANYVTLKGSYEKAYMDYDRKYSYTNMVTEPYPADKKAYPVRWLIVVLSALGAFFLSIIVILTLENYKGMKGSSS